MSNKYAKETEIVRRLKGEGLRDEEIAMAVGLTTKTVQGICARHQIKRPTSGRVELSLGPRLVEALQAEAARRGVPFGRFMRKLLLTVVQPDKKKPKDTLFPAILDL